MKYILRFLIFTGMYLLLAACGSSAPITPSPVSPLTSTETSTLTAIPTQESASNSTLDDPLPTVDFSTPSAGAYPTLLPTIDPESARDLLREAISIQTLTGIKGHTLQQITGWDYGFQQFPGNGYTWLDSRHLLLHPRTGEEPKQFMDGSRVEDSSSQPGIVNLEDGRFWYPWLSTPTPIYYSPELGIVFLQEIYGSATGPAKEAVFTYTLDGQEITRYWGKILGVSPSGTKILVDEDTVIDLKQNKIIDLAWHMDYDLYSPPKLYWSSDEARLYRCCFYFADLKTGESYSFNWSDMRGQDGKTASFSLQPHSDGRWVRNDRYFFALWDYWSYAGDPTVMFSPTEMKYYIIETPADSAIRADTTTYTISPDGQYVWILGYSEMDSAYHSFLVDLSNFNTTSYDIPNNRFVWSADSKFGWMLDIDTNNSYILSVDSKELLPFPVNPQYETASWHPKESILAYMAENNQTLALLNAVDMTVQGWKLPKSVASFLWSPDGDRMAFVLSDGSLWQADTPNFQNLEQITAPMPGLRDVSWSPDGSSIAFVSGTDIYVVKARK